MLTSEAELLVEIRDYATYWSQQSKSTGLLLAGRVILHLMDGQYPPLPEDMEVGKNTL